MSSRVTAITRDVLQLKLSDLFGPGVPKLGYMYPVVCLRGGRRGTCLGPPLLGALPLRCYARIFSLFLMKNLLFTHIMYYKAD